jgi:hypothetical protein
MAQIWSMTKNGPGCWDFHMPDDSEVWEDNVKEWAKCPECDDPNCNGVREKLDILPDGSLSIRGMKLYPTKELAIEGK